MKAGSRVGSKGGRMRRLYGRQEDLIRRVQKGDKLFSGECMFGS